MVQTSQSSVPERGHAEAARAFLARRFAWERLLDGLRDTGAPAVAPDGAWKDARAA